MKTVFYNRREAGKRLATKLTAYANHPQAIVLGLARGGVPVAYEIAKTLNLPLDVCLVKKLGLPNDPEIAMGAIVEDALLPNYSGNVTIIDRDTGEIHGVDSEQLRAIAKLAEGIAALAKAELRWRERCYRSFRPMLKIPQRTVIVVDDGIATGQTMQAAVNVLQRHKPEKIIVATPIASLPAIEQLATQVDDFAYLAKPKSLDTVDWYKDFTQTTDRKICDLLSQQTCKTSFCAHSLSERMALAHKTSATSY